ncbi:MAG TPA: tetratricopeptide repeat protein, partial [Phycisphaerae bacterium]
MTYARRMLHVASIALVNAFWMCEAAARAGDSPASQAASAPSDAPDVELPTDPDELLLKGYYERAAEAYARQAETPARKLPATIGLARCKLRVGAYDEAAELLNQAEALVATKASENKRTNRVSAEWHTTLAETLAAHGKYDDALTHLRAALELDRTAYTARTRLGEMLEMLGRRDEAIEVYRFYDELLVQRVPETAEQVTAAAVGFYRFTVLTRHPNLNDRTDHVLHELLQQAYERLDRAYWPARIAAADLLAAKFNFSEEHGAVNDYKAALRINTNLPEAHVGLGKIALDGWDFEEAERRAKLALDINPNYVPALDLRAALKLQERRYAEAIATAEKALAINPNDLYALGLAAAAHLCRPEDAAPEGVQDGRPAQDPSAALRRRAEALNPCSAIFHAIVADTLGGLRQYQASEAEYLRAIECEPTDPNPRCELGMMYMQWGREDKARAALEAAWALDEYNQRTKNTLDLLDLLEGFASHETPHFIVRYDKNTDSVLAEYFGQYLEQIYSDVTADYDTPLDEKTVIEIFPTHRQFGVRITGKPWIHTVGACTGRVIALDSPRRHPQLQGPYNFARVLRHEFTHTVTLAATHNRIAHWFTEGLAVYQENSPRSFDWAQLLAEAARRNELFTLESLDWGFSRPRKPTDRQMAYAQSEWMCEYIVERYGFDTINKLLAAFRNGQSQKGVFTSVLGIAPEVFDAEFREWARNQVKAWGFPLDPPEDPIKLRALALIDSSNAGLLGRLATAEYDADEHERALDAARKALAIDAEQPQALRVLVKLLEIALSNPEISAAARAAAEEEAMPLCERLMKADPASWAGPRVAGTIALRRGDYPKAEACFTTLKRLCPLDTTSFRGLAAIYLQRGNSDAALPDLLQAAHSEEHDADIPLNVARIYDRQGKLPDARHWYRQAIYIDPFALAPHEGLA